ncbi:MAG TPA: metalloregulator ArsR/SmtB family transcription factor [Steroidobacteraceae bacterium]
MPSFDELLSRLRAVAEPSRLRLLFILARGEFAVTELTSILGQSQPRVSRHLKLLCDAHLLERYREQHWILYRVPTEGAGREFVRDLLSRLQASDPTLLADSARVAAVLEERGRASAGEGGRASASAGVAHAELATVLAAELGDRGRGALFYYGQSPTDVLGAIASRARRVVGMHASRLEVQRARAALHSRGLSHCALQQGELKSLPHAAEDFDTAILDRALVTQERPVEALREVARLLDSRGELLLVEDYDALALRTTADNPLAALREWLAEAGLVCTRLRPLDLDGQHLVLAVAHAQNAVTAAA